MEFHLDDALPVLRRTPTVLRRLLADLPDQWTRATEGPGTWSPFDIVGHLVHGERTDWVPRIEHILRHGNAVPFQPFVRDAMLSNSMGASLGALLDTFDQLRRENLERLAALALTPDDLDRQGLHPELGLVTMRQHLATWTAHDLSHVGQVVRVMAKQYREAVGPWRTYLPLLGTD